MSGTHESAQLAAREAPVPVTVVDSRQVGVATGYAALSAQDVADAGGSTADAAAAARARAEACSALFYVDTLEYLRRGGRIGATAALVGGALSVKPLLRIDDGRVVNLDRVRTSARALSRMEDLIVDKAGDLPSTLCVSHLANPDRAGELASGWASGWRAISTAARCGAVSSAPSWAPMSVRAWSRRVWRRCSTSLSR